MKKFTLMILIIFSLLPYNLNALESVSKNKLKGISGQAGIETNFKADTKDSKPAETSSQLESKPLIQTNIPLHRGAGISIFIDDIKILITKLPDRIYWDTDGVK